MNVTMKIDWHLYPENVPNGGVYYVLIDGNPSYEDIAVWSFLTNRWRAVHTYADIKGVVAWAAIDIPMAPLWVRNAVVRQATKEIKV